MLTYSYFVLTFTDPPHRKPVVTIESELTTISAIYGQPLQLVCKANGYPKPKFVWKNKDTGTDYLGEVIICVILDLARPDGMLPSLRQMM